MTQKRRDEHSTEYGLWTREQPELDSSLGFVATNLDWIWANYRTGLWMLKEEKRHRGKVRFYQGRMFTMLDTRCRADENYRGFHKIVFENTNPDDGQMWLDGKEIQRQDLIEFLRFEKPPDWYLTQGA